MPAAVLTDFGQPMVIDEVHVDAPGPDEVLVRTVASGICHSDRLAQAGCSPRAPATPIVLGHEASGFVEAVGTGVTLVNVGDPVIITPAPFCGMCEWCQRGLQQHCCFMARARPAGALPRITRHGAPVAAFVGVGGFASQMLVHERAAIRLPPAMPLDLAALIGCAVHTGIGAVRHTARVRLGDTVAVIGCGGVGLNVVQGARLSGAAVIIAVDVRAAARDRAVQFGASIALDGTGGDLVDRVRELTGGGVDHVFEAVGRASTIDLGCRLARTRGTVTVVGLPRPQERIEVPASVLFDGVRLQGSKLGQRVRLDTQWYCEEYLAGRLRLDELISSRITIEQIDSALARLDEPESGLARSMVIFE